MKKRSRRRRGEGSITQRKDGTWTGYVLTNKFVKGRRQRRYASGPTYEDVRRELVQLQSAVDAGQSIDPTELTLDAYLTHWLDSNVRPSVAESTYKFYERHVRIHIIPAIGHVKIRRLNELHVEQMIAELDRNGLGRTSQGNVHSTLKRALQRLVPRTIPYNPCVGVSKPRGQKIEIHPLDRDQAERLMDCSQVDRLHALYVTALLSGARQGELFALCWDDVDFDDPALTIRKTVSDGNEGLIVKIPKTKSSRRRVTLPDRAITVLQDHRKRMLVEGHTSGPVFCDTTGGHLRRQNVLRRSFKPLLLTAELPKIRFHDLRHTHATLLLLAGENPKVVSERLGHSKVSITLDIYSHVLPSMQRQAAAKLDEMFG